MAEDIPLENARPAEFVFEKQVQQFMGSIHTAPAARERTKEHSTAA